MIAHNVFITLKDKSVTARERFVADSHKYLAGIAGIRFYAAGLLADEFDRPVNDRQFDVALHVVFADADGLTSYLEHPKHLEFVERHRPNWASIRVFDSAVTQP